MLGSMLGVRWIVFGNFARPHAILGQAGCLFEQECQKGRLHRPLTLTCGSLFGPFWHPLHTLGAFWGTLTSKMRGFLDDPFLDHILHRFWAPLGGVRHAIRSCLCMFAKGRPFWKRDRFEVHLELILEPKRGPESQLY